MLDSFNDLSPVLQAFLACIFTWSITALGASIVFFFKKVNKTIMDALLGFAAGVMVAASFFSLISPALEMAEELKMNSWIVISLGFLSGGVLLFIGDKVYDYLSRLRKDENSNKAKRCFMLISSITLHNIPEGMAVGVAFGSLAYSLTGATLSSALALALGLRREGYTRGKAFFYGQLSGIVEPIAAVIGALLVLKIQLILPFLLAFAAGAMIYVVVEELIPESQTNKKKDLMALFTILGFMVMMILDVALG